MSSIVESSYTSVELFELKDKYASERASGGGHDQAAAIVFGACIVNADGWQTDPFVMRRIAYYKSEPDFVSNSIMTQSQFALQLQIEMLDETKALDYRYKMFHLFARTQKYIEMGAQGSANRGGLVNNGLIVMSDHGTKEEWAAGAREQQMKLVSSVKD